MPTINKPGKAKDKDKKKKKKGASKSATASISEKKVEKKNDLPEVVVHEKAKAKSVALTGTPAQVHVLASRTVNLGDFNSVRVEVGITMPCDINDTDQTYTQCKEWVDTRMNELMGDGDG